MPQDGLWPQTSSSKRSTGGAGLALCTACCELDPWSGQHWGNGIRPEERPEAVAVVQQTVLERGAHGIGVLLSEEAPHGHQALGGAVLPTNLGLGATFDSQGVQEAEAAVAAELAASGIHIALVSGLDIARDPRWGRCEECFGEDPLMASRMCEAIVTGMQGEHRSKVGRGGVAVVLKHLAAQGEAVGGRNGQSAVLGPHDLHEIHLPPVAAGVRAGALGFMAAYNDIDSVPCCANPWLLEDYLRDQLGFDGIVMADGLAVDRLEDMAGSIPAAGRAALLAGVDVSLWMKDSRASKNMWMTNRWRPPSIRHCVVCWSSKPCSVSCPKMVPIPPQLPCQMPMPSRRPLRMGVSRPSAWPARR